MPVHCCCVCVRRSEIVNVYYVLCFCSFVSAFGGRDELSSAGNPELWLMSYILGMANCWARVGFDKIESSPNMSFMDLVLVWLGWDFFETSLKVRTLYFIYLFIFFKIRLQIYNF